MSPEDLYQWLLGSLDLPQAVAALHDAALCCLSGWLRQTYEENHLTGEVLGICLVEQARRFERITHAGRKS